jgi:hypothetical protein
MSNDHIKLVNKGGKIVGVDPDTGDEVPIELGSGLGSTNEPVPDTSYFEALSVAVLNNGGPVSDGDGTERQIWVIANGASDPAGANPEDIILEEQ